MSLDGLRPHSRPAVTCAQRRVTICDELLTQDTRAPRLESAEKVAETAARDPLTCNAAASGWPSRLSFSALLVQRCSSSGQRVGWCEDVTPVWLADDQPPVVVDPVVTVPTHQTQVLLIGGSRIPVPPSHMVNLAAGSRRAAPDAAAVSGDHREPLSPGWLFAGPAYVQDLRVAGHEHLGDLGVAADRLRRASADRAYPVQLCRR